MTLDTFNINRQDNIIDGIKIQKMTSQMELKEYTRMTSSMELKNTQNDIIDGIKEYTKWHHRWN